MKNTPTFSGLAVTTAYGDLSHVQPIVDALTAHVALLDRDGTIIGVNVAWKGYADANGGRLPWYGVGTNYLDLLDHVRPCGGMGMKKQDDVSVAPKVARALRQVLDHRLDKFQIEYPCDSPTEQHWYLLTITRFPGDGRIRAVVAHEDLTALKMANEVALHRTKQLAASYSNTVDAIALAVEKRDPYTAGHQHQVSSICDMVAQTLGLGQDQRHGLLLGAKIHDIGKIGVPSEILGKPGRLSRPEFEIIRSHPETGYDILKGVPFPWPIAEMVYQHHERLDGSGYPRGLRGDDICLEARIIAVADVFDAITAHRPYRAARSREEAIDELNQGRGKIYDADVVDAMLLHIGDMQQA